METARWRPQGKRSLGGFLRIRLATRKAIGGSSDSESSIHAAFMACELPSVRYMAATAETR